MHVQVVASKDHNTSKYDHYFSVVRRGKSCTVRLNTPKFKYYKNIQPTIRVINAAGKFAVKPNGDESISLYLEKEWRYSISSSISEYGILNIKLFIPYNASIGKYTGFISYSENTEDQAYFSFIVVFNPWHSSDGTFFKETHKLNDYLLNENTLVYFGTKDYSAGKQWYLGQFQRASIEALLVLLAKMDPNNLSSPINVARELSALVNSNDDNGVIYGNWSGSYTDGTSPMAWNSSVEILRKYANKRYPVKYGQCWVYAAVLCTLCRSVGIPNRVVTGYDAFHDGDGSLDWEIFYDENLNMLDIGRDSIWNFHCWTESWLNRIDIGEKYSGWQILDGTPQERSHGIFRVGPASRHAIKEGIISLNYDTKFVFAEVNADKTHYIKRSNGTYKCFKIEKGKVGTKMITKGFNSSSPENLTSEYKYPDNSIMDRLIDSRVFSHSEIDPKIREARNSFLNLGKSEKLSNDDKIQLKLKASQNMNLGENYTAYFKAVSKSSDPKGVVRIQILLMTYTGVIISRLFSESYNIKEKTFKKLIEIDGRTIAKKCNNDATIIKMYAVSTNENGSNSTKYLTTNISKHTIEITHIDTNVKLGHYCNVSIKVANSLKKKIKNAKVYIESPCLYKRAGFNIKDIQENDLFATSFKVKPIKQGTFNIWIYIDSENISGFHTSSTITII